MGERSSQLAIHGERWWPIVSSSFMRFSYVEGGCGRDQFSSLFVENIDIMCTTTCLGCIIGM